MSRIYVITTRAGAEVRLVRAGNLNTAVRAFANEQFKARAMTSDEVLYQAMRHEADVLDATEKQADIEDVLEEPAPMKFREIESDAF